MATPSWRKNMEAVATATITTTLIFKVEIHIRVNLADKRILLVNEIPIPRWVLELTDEPSKLKLKQPWHVDPGERDIPGIDGLQRRISSSDEWEDRCYFIPSGYLSQVIQE
jgi:hypothetical protein